MPISVMKVFTDFLLSLMPVKACLRKHDMQIHLQGHGGLHLPEAVPQSSSCFKQNDGDVAGYTQLYPKLSF